MRYLSAIVGLLALISSPQSLFAAEATFPHKCTLKTELIEKHLQVLENKYQVVQQADVSEEEARDFIKQRVRTLLVDVQRSLDHPVCGSAQRARLENMQSTLEKMMKAEI